MKSERLKKLESELRDLTQWMQLGLVPKKEIDRHKEEMRSLENKIHEEKERLQLLKESGEVEEFVTPRRSPAKTVYPDGPSMSDMEFVEATETEIDIDPGETVEIDLHDEDREEGAAEIDYSSDDDEDPFSDRNRWRRGGIVDPDANEW
ncbi:MULTISPECIES: hypothetical protein [Chlamydia]|uniref:Uncharacterized protein n=2 Tax=Chlamydia TaxID=810 RepID=A0ABN0MNV9_CHLPS|nr:MULTISPECIES: hypothetical protein [Chlamydia]AFS19456.1 hypothetical protein B595_0487 [Chlamydia psittaci 84/55]AFS22646.1 hypothetical protein B600_0486 [Chlamydia psittaci VS225]AGE75001.1 hypothetical protein AO9_02195 [Chlamydia psittaci Mat116]EPJ15507.1 hypothetical protein CP02DC18_0877 [Chlamydia psittaci 02DC18]EPJ16786.1 hypothetical protein CP02DC22_0871 [Chlamydia psittaci 02DC22]EPJ20110.1 hypothetical protein CP02DC21_0854 [Chlamydia psittaci 02DC21]EPJ21203.1 hypothetical